MSAAVAEIISGKGREVFDVTLIIVTTGIKRTMGLAAQVKADAATVCRSKSLTRI